MQVNSAQDYLTRYKRRVVASTYYSTPPEQRNKFNSVYLSATANAATQRIRFVLPSVSAWRSVPGGATFSSDCTGCAANSLGAPGAFSTTNTKDVVSRQALQPIGVRATVDRQ